MAFSYLDENNLGKKYQDAKDYTERITKPFPEWERIANNLPSEQRDKRYSDVTDGTTSSVVRKRGKRVVQQIPTGKIDPVSESDWLPIVAEDIFLNHILPYANLDFDFIQKNWQIIENGEKFGGTAIYVPMVDHDGVLGPDMSLPYWADAFIPEGYKSANATKYRFLRSWWTEDDVDYQIAEEERLKEEDPEFESTWDLKALESIKKKFTNKDDDEQTPTERDREGTPEGIEVVLALQEGKGATFYTFHPSDDDESEYDVTILRRKINKHPGGKMPLFWYFADTDGYNPLGRSTVELIGPLQNLIDTDMQMYQWNRALMLAPPLNVYGSGAKKISYAPNAINRITDPNGKVEALNVDTSAVVNYPDIYGLQKSQLLNLVSSPDTSISAEIGNPGFGKTPAAINAQAQTISADDNYVRKNYEAAFEMWAEMAINLYFAERKGVDVIQLQKETVEALKKLADDGKFDMSLINDHNEIMIDFDTATPALKFRVDASTSKMKDDASQSEVLTALLQTLESSQILAQTVPQEKVLAAWNAIVSNSGVENPEDLRIDIEEWQEQMMQQQMMAEQQMAQQAIQEQQMAEQQMQAIPEAELARPDQEEVDAVTAELRSLGVPEELIAEAQEMLDKGYTADEVLMSIQGVMANAGR